MQAGEEPPKGLLARWKNRRRERAAQTGDSPERASERMRAGQYPPSPVEGQDSGAVVERAMGLGLDQPRKQHSDPWRGLDRRDTLRVHP
jgi:hypothetical protein